MVIVGDHFPTVYGNGSNTECQFGSLLAKELNLHVLVVLL
jgi:hypothetical protein